ncbi:hypothetical protein KAR34_13470 [bacterium]|nr:hypothetical protein [bacterium]
MSAPLERLPLIVRTLRELGAKQVILFGSAAVSPEKARDIDLAIAGIPLTRLLDAEVKVHDILQYPLDLVSREENPAFYQIIREYGQILYEQK